MFRRVRVSCAQRSRWPKKDKLSRKVVMSRRPLCAVVARIRKDLALTEWYKQTDTSREDAHLTIL